MYVQLYLPADMLCISADSTSYRYIHITSADPQCEMQGIEARAHPRFSDSLLRSLTISRPSTFHMPRVRGGVGPAPAHIHFQSRALLVVCCELTVTHVAGSTLTLPILPKFIDLPLPISPAKIYGIDGSVSVVIINLVVVLCQKLNP